MTRYNPAVHDATLRQLNLADRSDQEIADAMGFSKQTIWSNRSRLGLPGRQNPRPVRAVTEQAAPIPKPRVNPLDLARHTLRKRLEERPAGFFLDRVPSSLTTVMKATNRVLADSGHPQVGPENWHV